MSHIIGFDLLAARAAFQYLLSITFGTK